MLEYTIQRLNQLSNIFISIYDDKDALENYFGKTPEDMMNAQFAKNEQNIQMTMNSIPDSYKVAQEILSNMDNIDGNMEGFNTLNESNKNLVRSFLKYTFLTQKSQMHLQVLNGMLPAEIEGQMSTMRLDPICNKFQINLLEKENESQPTSSIHEIAINEFNQSSEKIKSLFDNKEELKKFIGEPGEKNEFSQTGMKNQMLLQVVDQELIPVFSEIQVTIMNESPNMNGFNSLNADNQNVIRAYLRYNLLQARGLAIASLAENDNGMIEMLMEKDKKLAQMLGFEL